MSQFGNILGALSKPLMQKTPAESGLTRLVGQISTITSTALAVLSVWLVYRLIEMNRHSWGLFVLLAMVLGLAAMFAVVAYRILVNRPNRQGSLLPAWVWSGLSAVFLVAGLAGLWIAVTIGDFATVAGAVGAFVLSLLCFAADRQMRRK